MRQDLLPQIRLKHLKKLYRRNVFLIDRYDSSEKYLLDTGMSLEGWYLQSISGLVDFSSRSADLVI